MGTKTAQADAVARLVHESVASVDALTPEAMRAVLPALRAARDELRTDLRDWLQAAPGNGDRFTAHENRVALRYLEGALERVKELQPAMAKGLADGRKATGPVAVKNLETEISRLSSVFEGTPSMPRIDIAAVMARSESALWRRHASSAKRYAGGVGEDIRKQFAIGVAKGEKMKQLVTRLRRLGDPGAKKRGIDPGDDAASIADGLFRRHKWWAERLVRTEMMYAYNTQHDEATREADEQIPSGEERYLRKWDATADNRLCPLCRELDGTVATIDGPFAGGIQRPPRHPCCRCLALAWKASWGGIVGPLPKGWGEEERKAKPEKTKAAKKAAPEAKAKKPKPEPRPDVKTKPVKPTKQAKAATPLKVKKPLVPEMASVPRLVGPGGDVMDALARGDLNAVARKIDDAIAARGMKRSSTANNGTIIVDDARLTTRSAITGKPVQAAAVRGWDGQIVLSSSSREAALAYGQAAGSSSPAALAEAIEKHTSELYKLRVQMGSSPSARKRVEAMGETRESIIAKENALRQRLATAERTGASLNTIIHETLHGFSPGEAKAYHGTGAQVEEITTEVMARVIGRDWFGIKMESHNKGPYAGDIHAATKAIAEVTGQSETDAYGTLQRAAERYKRRPGKMSDHNAVTDAFIDEVVTETGASYGATKDAILRHFKAAAGH